MGVIHHGSFFLGANPALYSRKLMHYAQLELDRIKSNVRPYPARQDNPDPVLVLENAYHLTTLDAQHEASTVSVYKEETTENLYICFSHTHIHIGYCGINNSLCGYLM